MTQLDNENLSKVAGGGTDITDYRDAMSIALQLGPEHGIAFLNEWRKYHGDLYEEHKTEFENLFEHQ